jgi:dTDP-4-amino-4,6-dideoxygalactose transaminase
MGDGGALFCQDEELAIRIRMMANHGQRQRYQYDAIGMNSRLDTIQAAILRVKLPHLNFFNKVRQETADNYSLILKSRSGISVPEIAPGSSHVFHQYTIRFEDTGRRDEARENLSHAGIQSIVYYPLPLHMHPAYRSLRHPQDSLPTAEKLSSQVLSLPIHSEMTEALVQEICSAI